MSKSKFDMIYESIMSELLCEEDEMFTIELDWADEEKSDSYKDKAKENSVEVVNVVEAKEDGKWPVVTFKGTKENLEKLAAGFYAKPDWITDDFLVFQYKYPKFIFSYESALYLLNLADSLPQTFEVTGPKNYRPFSPKENIAIIHTDYKKETYEFGIAEVETNLGNKVLAYNAEKTVCDLIRRSEKIDSEIYTKALYNYSKLKNKNPGWLIEYAKIMGIQKKCMTQ